jgi:hypothetical protein
VIFGGQQKACTNPCPNLCFLGIPQTSFSIKFKGELCDIYPDCTKQIDSMLNKQTNRSAWKNRMGKSHIPQLCTLCGNLDGMLGC